MAKHTTSDVSEGPSKEDMRRYQAEDLVNRTMKDSPAYKKAMKAAMDQMRKVEHSISRFGLGA